MSQRFIFTFNDPAAYEKYKVEVKASGGTISNDLGSVLLGFTADIPPTLVETILSTSFASNGISTFEPDSVVTTQV